MPMTAVVIFVFGVLLLLGLVIRRGKRDDGTYTGELINQLMATVDRVFRRRQTMKIFGVVFFFVVLLSVTTFRILNYDGQLDGPSVEQQTITAMCDRDPQVLAWDRNWDPNNKVFVSEFGSKEGLHDLHVSQCVSDHLHGHH
jgi:hypothetical protein